jgi:hypothetical protein
MGLDLLWDAPKRVQFMSTMASKGDSMLEVLQCADKTFQRKDMQRETAINDKGFEVDFLRRQPVAEDPYPFRFSDDDRNLWPIQVERAAALTQAPVFQLRAIDLRENRTIYSHDHTQLGTSR